MEELQHRYEKHRDSRCVFTFAYALTTRELGEAIDSAGFADPDGVVKLAEKFAERYFVAVSEYDAGTLVSGAWKAVLDAIVRSRSSVLEDLVFGITAHIVHDLPLTLTEIGFETPAGLQDHDRINDVLGKAIDLIRDRVTGRYNPGLRWLDRIERHYDQIASDYGIRMSRGLAWYNAARLSNPSTRDSALAAIELSPQVLVTDLRHPPVRSVAIVFAALRWAAALGRRWPSD